MRMLFDHEPGQLEARFSHDTAFDDINLDIRLGGDTTWITEWDAEEEPPEPQVRNQQPSVELTVCMSSVFCPFRNFIRFLEAITIGVQECAFHWQVEGPSGTMTWHSSGETGLLTVRWQSLTRGTRVKTRDVVETLYSAFRRFVESPDYDPLRFEQLTHGEALQLVLQQESLEELAGALVRLSAREAAAVISRMEDVAESRRRSGPALSFSISHFLAIAEGCELPFANFPVEWDGWNDQQRLEHLGALFRESASSWFGENLRGLRSRLVEEWLSQQGSSP